MALKGKLCVAVDIVSDGDGWNRWRRWGARLWGHGRQGMAAGSALESIAEPGLRKVVVVVFNHGTGVQIALR